MKREGGEGGGVNQGFHNGSVKVYTGLFQVQRHVQPDELEGSVKVQWS